MKILSNILFVEFAEMVAADISSNTIRNAKFRKSPSWSFLDDPADQRKVLIDYEKLNEEYKSKITAHFGDPYDLLAKEPIRNLIKYDTKANQFFLDYRYTGTDNEPKPLPTEHVTKYTAAANFLNMLKHVIADKKAIKNLLKLPLETFWKHAIEIIELDKLDLPTSYRRLVTGEDSVLQKYIRLGHTSLIDSRFGNARAAKVKDELSTSTLLEMIAHTNQYDDVFIDMQYNQWAKTNGYKIIEPQTVGLWRRKTEKDTIMFREGNASFKSKYLPQAKGKRPSTPLYMVESDDNHLDLLFLDPNDFTAHKHYHKYIAIVVVDSFNDYVLGYAYAEKLSADLIKAAYLNAMYYIRSLTGAWHIPHEIKTDNWDISTLQPYYENIAKFGKTPVGSKNRGYIENFFGSAHWKRALKIGANNYTGNNITAIHRGVNIEALGRNKKDYPTIGKEAEQQIETIFYRHRHMPQSNGISKHDQWLNAFNATPAEHKRQINDEQFLLKFGITHNEDRPIRITNRGVEPQIAGVKYSFDLNGSTSEHIGKNVHVIYDPFDMSRVLITDHQQVRLIGKEARLNPRAMQDATEGSRTYLNATLAEKKNQVEVIANKSTRRKLVLESHGASAEDLLQAGVMVKEIKQASERVALAQEVSGNYTDDYFEQM